MGSSHSKHRAVITVPTLQRERIVPEHIWPENSAPIEPAPIEPPANKDEPEPENAEGQLCSVCEVLNITTMMRSEVTEKQIGVLTDYSDTECPFCALISTCIVNSWGAGWDTAKVCTTAGKAPELFAQTRSPLTVNRNGRTEHPQPRLLLAISERPPGFKLNRASIRQLDRGLGLTRFIIGEIEILPDGDDEDVHFLPRRHVGPSVDIGLVKHWLERCKQRHQHGHPSRSSGLFSTEHPFRLVDVVDKCLVQKQDECGYAALSYVWGRIPTILFPETGQKSQESELMPILLTMQSNVDQLSQPGSLSPTRPVSRTTGVVPATVRDAMELTQRLGMRYLWVDTLCIVQDDDEDKALLIGRMDDVYNGATVTFVAAFGEDAHAGLRGVSPRAGRPITPVEIAMGEGGESETSRLRLSVSLPSLCEEARKSTWNSRGWTFQEQGLSRRCLYFTAEEVFFCCSDAQWREGYDYSESQQGGKTKQKYTSVQFRTGPPWWANNLRRDLDPTPYHYLGDGSSSSNSRNNGGVHELNILEYQQAVQDYSRRHLTKQSDVLNAFDGVLNRFSGQDGLRGSHIQGIPTRLLFQALLWFPSATTKRRVVEEDSSVSLSSWSWAAWSGPIEFFFADSLWLSRNISQAPLKRVPMFTAIAAWYYGGTEAKGRRHPSCRAWEKAAQEHEAGLLSSPDGDGLSSMTSHLQDLAGIRVDTLLSGAAQPFSPIPISNLNPGELGFFAPFLPQGAFSFTGKRGRSKDPQAVVLEVNVPGGPHTGEFRFDDSDVNKIKNKLDELVAIMVADTITKPPDTVSLLLGLCKGEDGAWERLGVGFVNCSKLKGVPKPPWEYKFFRVR